MAIISRRGFLRASVLAAGAIALPAKQWFVSNAAPVQSRVEPLFRFPDHAIIPRYGVDYGVGECGVTYNDSTGAFTLNNPIPTAPLRGVETEGAVINTAAFTPYNPHLRPPPLRDYRHVTNYEQADAHLRANKWQFGDRWRFMYRVDEHVLNGCDVKTAIAKTYAERSVEVRSFEWDGASRLPSFVEINVVPIPLNWLSVEGERSTMGVERT